jgi:hypothetical protein
MFVITSNNLNWLLLQEPEPAEPWSGVWDANNPTECAQTGLMEINVTQG